MYTNLTLRGPEGDVVLDYLNENSITAYVIAPQDATVVVYDQASECQDETIITARAQQLSQHFECAILTVLNHDDDILVYWLYENGTQTDRYDSAPGYFTGDDHPPSGGNAAALCRAFGADGTQIDTIQAILEPPSPTASKPPFNEMTALHNRLIHSPERGAELLSQALGGDVGSDPDTLNQKMLAYFWGMAQSDGLAGAMDQHEMLFYALGLPDCAVGFGFDHLNRGEVPDGLAAEDLKCSGPQ